MKSGGKIKVQLSESSARQNDTGIKADETSRRISLDKNLFSVYFYNHSY